MIIQQAVRDAFKKGFGQTPRLFLAPGRINLIGEHVDYNEGLVLPTAIDRQIVFALAANDSGVFNCYSLDREEEISFGYPDFKPGHHWSNYLMGVLAGLRERGSVIGGLDCVFGGNIPQGAGLSSSAALCCGFGWGVNQLFQLNHDRQAIAIVGQEAEHHFAGVKCGIMDQYASLFSEKDHVLLLDCRTLTHKTLPLALGEYQLLLINSNVDHQLASTAYNDRRAACEEGVSILHKTFPEVNSLRDARLQHLDQVKNQMNPDTFRKCRFVISEIDRVIMSTKFLNKKDIESFGALMFQTHHGLSKEYDVSCPETDFLVELGRQHKGVVGARMMGGGFGGCTLNIVQKTQVQSFTDAVRSKYFAQFRKEADFYLVKPSAGVHELTTSEVS